MDTSLGCSNKGSVLRVSVVLVPVSEGGPISVPMVVVCQDLSVGARGGLVAMDPDQAEVRAPPSEAHTVPLRPGQDSSEF